MGNKNYIKGRNKEYRIVHEEKENGADIAFRSAGSHSPIDVVSINTLTHVIRFIQCKPEHMADKQKKKLADEQRKLNDIYRAEFVVL